MLFIAVVVSGMGKGATFVAMPFYQKQFVKKLSFAPFPGTLNLRVEAKTKRRIMKEKKIRIVGRSGKGGALCFAVKINAVPCVVIVPDKSTHAKNIIEVLSHYNLRKKLRLRNGRRVRLSYF